MLGQSVLRVLAIDLGIYICYVVRQQLGRVLDEVQPVAEC